MLVCSQFHPFFLIAPLFLKLQQSCRRNCCSTAAAFRMSACVCRSLAYSKEALALIFSLERWPDPSLTSPEPGLCVSAGLACPCCASVCSHPSVLYLIAARFTIWWDEALSWGGKYPAGKKEFCKQGQLLARRLCWAVMSHCIGSAGINRFEEEKNQLHFYSRCVFDVFCRVSGSLHVPGNLLQHTWDIIRREVRFFTPHRKFNLKWSQVLANARRQWKWCRRSVRKPSLSS